MNSQQLHVLSLRSTDVEGAVRRLNGKEDIYVMCLKQFLDDSTITELNRAIAVREWDEAFTAAHALKGLAGNMGFVPLMHSVGQIIVLIRRGSIGDIAEALKKINSCYHDIVDAIQQYFKIDEEISNSERNGQ